MNRRKAKPDILFANHGSIWLMRGNTPAGNDWIAEKVNTEDAISLGGAIAVEHRYAWPIADGAVADGLTVGDL